MIRNKGQLKTKEGRWVGIRLYRVLAALVTAGAVTMGMTVNAFAAKTISNSINATYTVQNSIFYVSSRPEFDAAYDDAQDGDTIYINDGSTIDFGGEFTISKSISLLSVPGGRAGVTFSDAAARLKLARDGISISRLDFIKNLGGEMINIASPSTCNITGCSFTGSGFGIAVHAACTSNDGIPEENGVRIAGNTFDNLAGGIMVSSGKKAVIESNTFSNMKEEDGYGGAVVVDSDTSPLPVGSISIKDNTVGNSTLCFWSNTKMGNEGNVTDAGWFDGHVTFENNAGHSHTLTAVTPLLLRLTSSAVVNNVTAGSDQDISFSAYRVSQHIGVSGVQFALKWLTDDGVLPSIAMVYNGSPVENVGGVFTIDALPGVDGDYTLKAVFNRKGTYNVEILGQQ